MAPTVSVPATGSHPSHTPNTSWRISANQNPLGSKHLLDAADASSPDDDDRDQLTARARDHLERAAQRAASLAAPAEAVRLYRAALQHAREPRDVHAIALVSATRHDAMQEDYVFALFRDSHVVIAAAGQDVGQFR